MGYYYVVLDSLGEFMRAFKNLENAEIFWVNRGGAMSGWKIVRKVSRY